jgi:FkbM family methyltransferase
MTGATGSIYTGLHEFEEMAFTLHLLRPDDLFVDVGANVGVYTVLAAAVAGARCVSVEPVPSTYRDLVANIRLNNVEDRIRPLQVGIGASPGECAFTSDLDTTNHVVAANESTKRAIRVRITTLDEVLQDDQPTLLKVDVEGFETQVLDGAVEVLRQPNLLALIVELNGSGHRYEFDEKALATRLTEFGFFPYSYSPFERQMQHLGHSSGGNTLFIREPERVADRLRSAAPVSVLGVSI